MIAVIAVALLAAAPLDNRPRFTTRECQRTTAGRSSRGVPCGAPALPFSLAPASGIGMGTACSGQTVFSVGGSPVITTRASSANCYSNDGQTITLIPANQPRVSSGAVDSSVLGLWQEDSRTNLLLRSRNLTNAVWVKTNVTCSRTSLGMNGSINTATNCQATAAGGTVTQSVTLAATPGAGSLHLKPLTVTGAIEVTIDGTNYFDVSGGLVAGQWRRVVPAETAGCTASAGSQCIVVPALAGTLTNPTLGVRIANVGDSIIVDYTQIEASIAKASATSPIETAGTAASRAAETNDFVVPTISAPNQFCMSATSVGNSGGVGVRNSIGVVGAGTIGGPISFDDFFVVVDSPVGVEFAVGGAYGVYLSGPSSSAGVHRFKGLHDGTLLNTCYDGVCAAGSAVPWSPPAVWNLIRVGNYDPGFDGYSVDGVVKELVVDSIASGCPL